MTNLSWLRVSFSEQGNLAPTAFHVQIVGASKVTCVRCAQNMFVGPQPFKTMRCTGCGMQFLTPLHVSYACDTHKPTVTEDFKFEKPLDIGTFLYNHGTMLGASFSRIGFVYYKDKSLNTSLIQRPNRKIRGDLKFLGNGWVKALAVLSHHTLRFFDLPNDSSFERNQKLLGEVQLEQVQIGTMSEYKGRRFILVLSRGSSSVLIQAGSEALQNWWKECLVESYEPHRDSCSFDITTDNETQTLKAKDTRDFKSRTMRSLRNVHLLTKSNSRLVDKNMKMSNILFDSVPIATFQNNNYSFYSMNSHESIHYYPDLTKTSDADDSFSSGTELTLDSSPSSDGEELSSADPESRFSEEYSEFDANTSVDYGCGRELSWEALINAFPLPPAR